MKKLIVLGTGGHARSLEVLLSPHELLFVGPSGVTSDEEILKNFDVEEILIYNGIGVNGPKLESRVLAYQKFKSKGFKFGVAVSDSAILKSNVQKDGVQIFHNCYIGPKVSISENVVINTGAIVEHDTSIGESSFVGPGAILCGGVEIGAGVFIGAGAILLPMTVIPDGSIVPAGARFPGLSAKNRN